MIFDKNYDRALWLLVALNKEDSERICKLINSIPEDIYTNIQKAIDFYYNSKYIDIKENVIYRANLVDKDGYQCAVLVKLVMGKLHFNIYRWNEDIERIEEEYQLVLSGINDKNISEMIYFDNKLIGKYSSEINNIKYVGYLTNVNTINLNRKYYLKRIPFCYIVLSFLGKKRIGMKMINILKNMPEEIYVDDFRCQEKTNGLVKKRVRNKNK